MNGLTLTPKEIDTIPESKASGLYFLVKLSTALLIIVSIALPSGSLFGFPVKHLAYLASISSIVALWVRESVHIDRWLLLMGVFVTAFVIFFIMVGLLRGVVPPGFVIKEATGFFTAITVLLVIIAAKSQGCISNKDIARYVFYGCLIFATWKSLIVFGLVAGVINYDQVSAFFMEQAGYRLVSSGIYGGWVRINLIIFDFLVAFMLFLVPTYPTLFDKVPKILRILFMPIGVACLIFAFSRLLFGLVGLLWIFSFCFRFKFITKLIWGITAAFLISASAPWIAGAVEQRFNSTGSDVSDNIRDEQINALLGVWSNVPVLGGGFGYYAKSMVRSWSAPYSYEVQWIGFLAKLGMIGILALACMVFALYFEILKGPRVIEHYVLAFSLSCFILGGFTNQYLVNSASGVFYCLHIVLAQYFRTKPENKTE